MASVLDISVLENFSNIFVFILVILLVVVLLSKTKYFANKAILWVVAIVVGILILLSDIAMGAISMIIPWFVIVLVFVLFLFIGMQAFGAKTTDFAGFSAFRGVITIVIILAFVVGILGYVRDNTLPSPDNETGEIEMDYTQTSHIIFHPKVLGVIFIFLIAIFTIALLAGKSS